MSDRQLQHLDILAFVGDAAAVAYFHARLVFGDEEVQLLGDRSRAHEGLEHLFDLAKTIAGFLFGLGADPLLGRFIVEQAGSRLDHEIVVAVDVSWIAKLPHQHHGALRPIIRQQRRAVAAVIGFAVLRLPLAVGPAVFERRGFEDVMIVREGSHFLDANAV